MASNRLSVFIPVLLLLSMGCKENTCNPLLNFKGITSRDDIAKLLKTDPNDWKLTDTWGRHEIELFDTVYNAECFPPSHFSIMAYPNPTSGPFQLIFNKTEASSIDIRLVDFDCRTLIYIDGIKNNSVALEPSNFNKPGIVRLYYRFVEDGCEYRGHGDIQIF